MASVKPTHSLTFLNKATGDKGVVGCAWANDDGSFSIKLNACVHLIQDPNVTIRLWPNNERSAKHAVEEERF